MNIIKFLRWHFGRKITLVNKNGDFVRVPACASIKDLVSLGFSSPQIKRPGVPLASNEWEARIQSKNRVIVREAPDSGRGPADPIVETEAATND